MENKQKIPKRSGRGGYRPGGGRPKGSKNKENKALATILEDEKGNLLKEAIKLAYEGNTAIMTKLLDKIVPTLNSNANINTELNSDDYISNIVSNLLNSENNSDNKAHIPADDNKPLVKSSNNNNLENN